METADHPANPHDALVKALLEAPERAAVVLREKLSLIECIDADEELLELQRHFGYQVRHLRPDEPDASYSQDPAVRAVLRALAWSCVQELSREDLVHLLRDLPPGHPLEKPLLVYIARTYGSIAEADVRYALEQTRPIEQAEELTMTVAEEWIQRGRQQGWQEGRQEGLQEAETRALLQQIELKFGQATKEAHRQRVEQGTPEELERWLRRIITANRVDDLFDD
ncbi:hypothetical protein [Halorhodospira halophila]|nr:hypothetical protein [Halorhodospira halophila]